TLELRKHYPLSRYRIAVIFWWGSCWRWHRCILGFGCSSMLLAALETGPISTTRLRESCEFRKGGRIGHACCCDATECRCRMNNFPYRSVIGCVEINDIRGHRKSDWRQDLSAIHDEHPLCTGAVEKVE